MRTAVTALAAVVVLSTGGAAVAAPSSFQLVFDGKHQANLLHQGTFTTSSSLCTAGTAEDVSIDEATLTATRQFTCNEGGSFTATVGELPAEHGGSGTWQIVSGTGPLTELRGKGTFSSVRTGGDPNNPETITFRSTWTGVADLDAAPPAVGLKHWSAKKLRRPRLTYRVGFTLSLTDAGGGPVSYELQIVDPRKPSSALVFKLGSAANGTVTKTFRIKVRKHTRQLRLKVDASDAVGNESAFAKTFRLR